MAENMSAEDALKALSEIVASPREDDELVKRPALIGKFLAIGNLDDAGGLLEGTDELLCPDRISGIVNCMRNQSFIESICQKLSPEVAFLNIEEDDEDGAPILGEAPSWERAHAVADFVSEHTDDDRRVLIHCREGRNRSATMIVATMMLNERYYLLDAVEELWSKRPFVLTNESFRKFLVQLAEQEGLLGRGKSISMDTVCTLNARHVKVGEKLGAGDFGAVYRGSWRGVKMALKFCSPEAYDELQRECALMDSLEHPNIVMIYGICNGSSPEWWPDDVKPPCLCCEILTGGTLLSYVKKHLEEQYEKLHWKVLLGMLVGAASGLSYLHSQGVMHRDLKSENILLDDNLNAKIADFGLSKAKKSRSAKRHTMSIGTYTHMAPEVMSGTYNLSCDVFSFGITISEVLTASDADDVVEQTRTGNFGLNKKGLMEFLDRELHPSLCFELVDVASACCDTDIDKRPAAEKVTEMLTTIEDTTSVLQKGSRALSSFGDNVDIKGRVIEHHPEDKQKTYRIRVADGQSYWFSEAAIQASMETHEDKDLESAKCAHTERRKTLLLVADGNIAAAWMKNLTGLGNDDDEDNSDYEQDSTGGYQTEVVETTHVAGYVGNMS